jgi:hypothetical protein
LCSTTGIKIFSIVVKDWLTTFYDSANIKTGVLFKFFNEVKGIVNNNRNAIFEEIRKLSILNTEQIKQSWEEATNVKPPAHMKRRALIEDLAYFRQTGEPIALSSDGRSLREIADLAKAIASCCVRNRTPLEDIHAGCHVATKTGDYSDVIVTDGEGNQIPWSRISHISDIPNHKKNYR